MPQIVETAVYLYAELPTEKAKENARQWWIEGMGDDWDDFAIENYENEVLPSLGFENAKISYSGFSSQGDGLSFVCDVDFLKYCAAYKVTIPKLLKKRLKAGTVQVWGKIVRTSHHYCHENTVGFDWVDVSVYEGREDLMREQVETLWLEMIDNARAKMRELYRSLEKEYDYQTSEEQIAEAMAANEYTFTESGKRFG